MNFYLTIEDESDIVFYIDEFVKTTLQEAGDMDSSLIDDDISETMDEDLEHFDSTAICELLGDDDLLSES